ncbi:MAG: NAD(P)/FAD-dependent oxidoreductase [Chlorobi bacterium]|nr:NAD(P)/FAD-dependent oxidoreductase [Chlorobiota bacterium]
MDEVKNNIIVPASDYPRVVVIGGGFAGISFIKTLRNKPVQVVLLDRNNYHLFQPLLYQVASCAIEPDSITFPLRKLFSRYTNFVFRMCEVLSVKPEQNRITTDKGSLTYDFLVVATGGKTNFFNLEQVKASSLDLKSIQASINIRSRILQNLERTVITTDPAEKDALTNFVVVGGGPAGVEMAGAIAEFKQHILPYDYPEINPDIFHIFLIEADTRILGTMSKESSLRALTELEKKGVIVLLKRAVLSYDHINVYLNTKETLHARTLVWTAGVTGQYPSGLHNLSDKQNNRLRTDRFNKVEGSDNIFAIGDVAFMTDDEFQQGHPMVAQVAIQQGHLLARNIINILQNKPLMLFKYKDKGTLATIGRNRAVAEIGKIKLKGYIAWLLWSLVHIVSISGFRNKVLVGWNWMWTYFTYDMGNQMIITKITDNKK